MSHNQSSVCNEGTLYARGNCILSTVRSRQSPPLSSLPHPLPPSALSRLGEAMMSSKAHKIIRMHDLGVLMLKSFPAKISSAFLQCVFLSSTFLFQFPLLSHKLRSPLGTPVSSIKKESQNSGLLVFVLEPLKPADQPLAHL